MSNWLPAHLHTETWREQALCAQADPDAWFPERGESARAAKRICVECPVARECLESALANSEQYGIWGGLSEHERRALTRERRRTRTDLGSAA